MVRTAPLRLYQGDTLDGLVLVKDEGQPANLTGYTATAQIRTDIADLATGPPAATITCSITPPDKIGLALTPSTVNSLPPGPLVWDLQITNGADVYTLLRGPVYIGKQVTV
jgi:hypothetical protein